MLHIGNDDLQEIASLITSLRGRYERADDPEFLYNATLLARDLPWAILDYLNRFRREEWGYALIRGHGDPQGGFGPTPAHWNRIEHPSPTLDRDFLLILYGAVLGDAFGWATQQDGRIVMDVLPIKEHEGEQLGTAADVELCWHTEDAFHPLRPDWIILACIRNPHRTATLIACVDDLRLSEEDVRVLLEPRFCILPDNSHLPKHNSNASNADFGTIDALSDRPPPISLLWGDPASPYIRADKSFWTLADLGDHEAQAALDRLSAEIRRNLREFCLELGDFCFLDNFKAVHGRRPMIARYDGSDRWLKRICVTRDLRKSRAERGGKLLQVVG